MASIRGKAAVAAFAISAVIASGVAASATPTVMPAAEGTECVALAGAAAPEVESLLTLAGLDPAEAEGPIGVGCTVAGRIAGAAHRVTLVGVEGTAYTCAKADEVTEDIVFFNECES
ncbi:hypothetical protein ACTG9Q_12255 [Actinokineospora sp. 24-640]